VHDAQSLPSLMCNAGRKFMPSGRDEWGRLLSSRAIWRRLKKRGTTVYFSKPGRRMIRRMARAMDSRVGRELLELWDERGRLR
jgi:hypothetical protein